MNPILVEEALDLIQGHLAHVIDAMPHDVHIRPRFEFDGRGHDVAYEFVVVWSRSDRPHAPPGQNWGTHRGCVRQKGTKPFVHVFDGHYDQTKDEALVDFGRRKQVVP